jgi:hypothetical protein
MRLEEAVVGRFVENCGLRLRILAVSSPPASQVVAENSTGGVYCNGADVLRLLPPECDSFDWQPEIFPQYWTTLDSGASNTAFVKRYDSVRWHTVRRDGSESIDLGLSSDWNPDGRKQITEAEALALLDKFEPVKPAIDPGEGYRLLGDDEVTLPTDQREYVNAYTNEWLDLGRLYKPDNSTRTVNDWRNCSSFDMVIRRKVEPVKPATRKVVLTEWYCWDTDGTGISAINWSEHKPRGWDKCHAIGTREIEVPL